MTTRRTFLELMGLGAVAAAAGPALGGCSEKPAASGTAQNLDKVALGLPAAVRTDNLHGDSITVE